MIQISSGRKYIYLLGAGFSSHENFPLIRDLRDRVLHFMQADLCVNYRRDVKGEEHGRTKGLFLQSLESNLTKQLGFEELLLKLRELEIENPHPYHQTRKLLQSGCVRFFWCLHNFIWRVSPQYTNFVRLVAADSAAIISFNWDLLAELALQQASIAWSYAPQSGKVPVLKLHGSINWSLHQENGLTAPGWTRISDRVNICFPSSPFDNPFIQEVNTDLRPTFFPGDDGFAPKSQSFNALREDASELLSNCEKIVIIGYSLPKYDSDTLDFLVTHSKGKRIEVHDPSPNVFLRYKEVFGEEHITFFQHRFEDWNIAAELADAP